jgi:hypothetical protein
MGDLTIIRQVGKGLWRMLQLCFRMLQNAISSLIYLFPINTSTQQSLFMSANTKVSKYELLMAKELTFSRY